MVKLTGPAASLAAAGSLAKTLTFSAAKGKRYLKRYAKPKQPRTKPQLSIRAAMGFLSGHWKILPQADPNTWTPEANQRQISSFNAFTAGNLKRHREMQGPSITYPATELGSIAAPVSFTVTGHVRRVHFLLDVTNLNQNWGLYIHWVEGNLNQPTWDDTIKIILTYLPGVYEWDWKPVDAGTYWFTDSRCTIFGKFNRVYRWRSVVVTN